MINTIVSEKIICEFRKFLYEEEKSENTVEKYVRDVSAFAGYCGNAAVTKDTVISYKQHLIDSGYAVRSINSMLASINCLLEHLGRHEMKVKPLKLQKEIYRPEEKELTKEEYFRLCKTAEKIHNERLSLILQTICSTGIRVSELQFVTVEAARRGEMCVSLKGKTRAVIIPKDLKVKLLRYSADRKIKSGMLFVTKKGKPINRTNIWREMKSLCKEANIDPEKVFPHNLRHLFARVFYGLEKDIAKLADILGHSCIETTRIYIIGTGIEHRKLLENMRLTI